jgi:hypothetical protein
MTTHPESSNTSEQEDGIYDDSQPPLWQRIVDLGASLPPETWDRFPSDLASNLYHYLYGDGKDE